MSQARAQEKSRTPQHGSFQNIQGNHNLSYHQAQQDFVDAMAGVGIAPADHGVIVADGALHRYRVEGDKQGTLNGFYVLHTDGLPSGAFGSWKAGINQTWCAKSRNEMTSAERQAQQHRINEARRAAVAELEQRHRDAADKAAYLWNQAKPAPADFPYLVNKGIQPGIARIKGDVLVLPIQSFSGELKSLQFIGEEGSKRLLSGGAKAGNFILVQSPDKPTRTMIAEGWATAQTLAEIEPQARVLAAIDAGNLETVAVGERKQWPGIEIVIALDFDAVGRTKGEHAARASGGLVLPPPDNLPPEITDWNDYAALVLGGVQ